MTWFRRPLLPLLLAYVWGLYLGKTFWQDTMVVASMLGLLTIAAVLAVRFHYRTNTAWILLLVSLVGAIRISSLCADRVADNCLLRQIDDVAPRVVTGTVVGSQELLAADSKRFTLRDVTVTSGGMSFSLKGRLSFSVAASSATIDGGAGDWVPGDVVRFLGTVRPVDPIRNFYGLPLDEMLARQQIYALASLKSERLSERVATGSSIRQWLSGALRAIRREATVAIFQYMPFNEARLMVCMLFNDTRQMTDEELRIFRDSGTLHLFAVSGMHVAILGFVLVTVLRVIRCPLRLSWIVTTVVLFLYICMIGFVAPAMRAFLMIAAYALGRCLRRELDPLSALLLGVALILAVDPLSAWQPGFQLSTGGVLGLVVFSPLLMQWCLGSAANDPEGFVGRLKIAIVGSCAATLGATLVLLPLQFMLFQQFNILSPLANLFEAVLAGPVLGAGLIAALGNVVPFLGETVGTAAGVLMAAVYKISAVTAMQEWASIKVPATSAISLWLYYICLFAGYYMTYRSTPEFLYKSRAKMTVHFAAGLCVLTADTMIKRSDESLRIWFLDVGQGDATLVQFPSGQSLLIDAGRDIPDMGKVSVLPHLRALGVWPVTWVVGTHPDIDHVGGLPSVLRNHAVRQYLSSNALPNDDLTSEVAHVLSEKQIETITPKSGEAFGSSGGVHLEVLNPPRNERASSGARVSDNNKSLVFRVSYKNFSALLMADAEAPVEQQLVEQGIGRCDVLKVGHHGSRTSSTPAFVSAVHPKCAVISCGFKNRYGHPHSTVLAHFSEAGSEIYRTDRVGAVLVETDGSESFKVSTASGNLPSRIFQLANANPVK